MFSKKTSATKWLKLSPFSKLTQYQQGHTATGTVFDCCGFGMLWPNLYKQLLHTGPGDLAHKCLLQWDSNILPQPPLDTNPLQINVCNSINHNLQNWKQSKWPQNDEGKTGFLLLNEKTKTKLSPSI